MHGKRVLITGASSGIGLVAARRLAERGAEVVLVCRDEQRGEAALREVTAQASPGAAPSLLLADLSSQAAVRALAAEVRDRFAHLDVLLNNAGAVFARREASADGIEMTFATNHLAPFLLTLLLMDLLRAAPSGRVVTVASRVHAGRLDLDDLQGERSYSAMQAYGQSKLENILFTYELARRLSGTNVTANCLAPGLVASNFGRNAGGLLGLLSRLLALTLLAVTPEEGAKTSVHLASSPEVKDMSGRYFYRCQEARSKPVSYDQAVAARLWEISADLTGVSPATSVNPADPRRDL